MRGKYFWLISPLLLIFLLLSYFYFNSDSNFNIGELSLSGGISENAEPVGEKKVFSKSDDIYLSFDFNKAFSSAQVKVEWVKVANSQIISTIEKEISGPRRVAFVAKSSNGKWQIGDYQVKVYKDGDLARTIYFKVQ
jgi:hypothetical protein